MIENCRFGFSIHRISRTLGNFDVLLHSRSLQLPLNQSKKFVPPFFSVSFVRNSSLPILIYWEFYKLNTTRA